MKINTGNQQIMTSGGMRTAGFQIEAGPKAFRVISQTLYKDPIKAIVRELLCNGWDGHQMNDNFDQNIDVHLPTSLEPWFSIRDYGVGMSDDTMFTVYRTVFGSTKDQDNIGIGGLGLGSKTPFAYNEGQAFTVTSICDGMKAVYSAYLNQGVPDITCISEPKPSDEPSGVEVKVPVVLSDIDKFVQAASETFFTFSKPGITTNLDNIVDYIKFESSVGDISIYDAPWQVTRKLGKLNICMGGVVYPLEDGYLDHDLYDVLGSIIPHGKLSLVHVPIGSIEFAPSREALHYDSTSSAVLNKVIKEAVQEYLDGAQAELDANNFEHPRQACTWVRQKYSRSMANWLNFKGHTCKEWSDIWEETTQDIKPSGYTVYNSSGNARSRNTRYYWGDIASDRQCHVIIDDMTSGGVGVVKKFCSQDRVGDTFYYHKKKLSTHAIKTVMDNLLTEGVDLTIYYTSELKAKGYVPVKAKPTSTTVRVEQILNGSLSTTLVASDFITSGEYDYVYWYRRDGFYAKPNLTFLIDKSLVYSLSNMSSRPILLLRKPLWDKANVNPEAKLINERLLGEVKDKHNKEQHIWSLVYSNRHCTDLIDYAPKIIKMIGSAPPKEMITTQLYSREYSTLGRLDEFFREVVLEAERIGDLVTSHPLAKHLRFAGADDLLEIEKLLK